jgi:hypothetical protein
MIRRAEAATRMACGMQHTAYAPAPEINRAPARMRPERSASTKGNPITPIARHPCLKPVKGGRPQPVNCTLLNNSQTTETSAMEYLIVSQSLFPR